MEKYDNEVKKPSRGFKFAGLFDNRGADSEELCDWQLYEKWIKDDKEDQFVFIKNIPRHRVAAHLAMGRDLFSIKESNEMCPDGYKFIEDPDTGGWHLVELDIDS